jgi:hypothetical protein
VAHGGRGHQAVPQPGAHRTASRQIDYRRTVQNVRHTLYVNTC